MTFDFKQIEHQFMALRPAGGFDVIMADPNWLFEVRSAKGEEKSPQAHYDCEPPEEIAKLPISFLAAKDCALFMWVTWPLMPYWQLVLDGLGFKFAGLAWEWIKYNSATEKYAFGGGYGTRKNLEPCLLATRGNPKLRTDLEFFGDIQIPEGVRSVRDFIQAMPLDCIRAPRRHEHSRKPDEQYERIDTLFDGRKIELFARQRIQRPGWQSWGDEIDKFEVGK